LASEHPLHDEDIKPFAKLSADLALGADYFEAK
jgi:hypothetical protein